MIEAPVYLGNQLIDRPVRHPVFRPGIHQLMVVIDISRGRDRIHQRRTVFLDRVVDLLHKGIDVVSAEVIERQTAVFPEAEGVGIGIKLLLHTRGIEIVIHMDPVHIVAVENFIDHRTDQIAAVSIGRIQIVKITDLTYAFIVFTDPLPYGRIFRKTVHLINRNRTHRVDPGIDIHAPGMRLLYKDGKRIIVTVSQIRRLRIDRTVIERIRIRHRMHEHTVHTDTLHVVECRINDTVERF